MKAFVSVLHANGDYGESVPCKSSQHNKIHKFTNWCGNSCGSYMLGYENLFLVIYDIGSVSYTINVPLCTGTTEEYPKGTVVCFVQDSLHSYY